MEKPDSIVLDQIISIIDDIREMDIAINQLKQKINELVLDISHEPNKIEIATYLYWLFPEVNVKGLAYAVTGGNNIHKFLDELSPVTTNICCDKCGDLIEIKSRSHLNEQIRLLNKQRFQREGNYIILCETCRHSVALERYAQSLTKAQSMFDRLNELRNMPYKEYLETTEWQKRRQHHLKSAGYRCQLCNSQKLPLDVHHRTYERRGEEYYKDLIVLCRECHHIFHKNGKIVQC